MCPVCFAKIWNNYKQIIALQTMPVTW
jgi:hypothetical protein